MHVPDPLGKEDLLDLIADLLDGQVLFGQMILAGHDSNTVVVEVLNPHVPEVVEFTVRVSKVRS